MCAYSCPINATANWRSNYAATPRTLPSAPQSGPCTSLRATEFRARPSRGSSTASSYNREPASRSWRRREAVSPSMTVAATAPRRPRNTHSSEGVVGCRPQSLQVAQAPEQAQRRRTAEVEHPVDWADRLRQNDCWHRRSPGSSMCRSRWRMRQR